MELGQRHQSESSGFKSCSLLLSDYSCFCITKNVLDEVKSLASKLQKRDQDIYEAYSMADAVINRVKPIRSNIDGSFGSWYDEILKLSEAPLRVFHGKPVYKGTNTPSTSPQEHYKRSVAIPLIDCFINQLESRFHGDRSHAHVLCVLYLQ